VVFLTALVAVVIPVSRCAHKWFSDISADKHIICGHSEHPESSADPQVLADANRFYWLNNGPTAAPLYAKAESLFATRGDSRNELHAKIGRLRSESETMSFVDLSRFLNDQLQNPIMRNDAALRPYCLAAREIERTVVNWGLRTRRYSSPLRGTVGFRIAAAAFSGWFG